MAVNDRILIDGIIDDRVSKSLPSNKRDEVFEFFSFEQLLKFADLSPEEIMSGWVDGEDDGGIDGFFIFVNDHLLTDPDSFYWPRGKADLSVWIITSKHHDTFKQATVDKLVATLSEILDFSRKSEDMNGSYSPAIFNTREKLIFAYRTLSTRISSFQVQIAYVSRGDADIVGKSILARAEQAVSVVSKLFGDINVTFRFVGSSELVALSRKAKKYSLELRFLECFSHGGKYVLLSRLEDYANFVRDEDGHLRRYLFESNVRDFMGLNRVNEDITESLEAEEGPDFWWLNNGITILASTAIITGKSIVLDDVEIVNGLQTTESIARYFANGATDSGKRSVLVKIIKTDDPAVRDAIIRATNNQTEVEQQSLHATDKVQRDIDDVLLRSGWYYDRRKNYYANQGYAARADCVPPLYVAAGYVGLIMRSPSRASVLRQKFMRNSVFYRTVYSETTDLDMWPKLVAIIKYVDLELVEIRTESAGSQSERFLKK